MLVLPKKPTILFKNNEKINKNFDSIISTHSDFTSYIIIMLTSFLYLLTSQGYMNLRGVLKKMVSSHTIHTSHRYMEIE